ncbi:MAG: phosphomannose isomerase type II C-terminal cupin domain [Methylobacteriaceae bacterium]|jgi:mannose-6-phosphate isomerase-like protein (cupin superfamily)|nr:phosphomannose isomerase type II C-terminal cupin domain [Methylobacteriaceae bacterium]
MAENVEYKVGDHDTRPWGEWLVLDTGEHHIVKRITVNPGARLSLQYHNFRKERWTAVAGEGLAEIDGVKHPLGLGGSVEVPLKAHHRASNPGKEPFVFIEVQYGDKLSEDDIVRVEDDYNRP